MNLVDASNRNFIASARKLITHARAGRLRETDGLFAFVSGYPFAYFNGCVVTKEATATQLEEVLEWVRAHGVPYRVWIAMNLADELGAVAERRGLERAARPYPNMALSPIPEAPTHATGVTTRMHSEAERDEFLDVVVDLGLDRELAERVYSPGFVTDDDVQLFTASLEGRDVGTSIAIRSGNAGGVYNVGVLEEARRRGVGTALTWAAVGASRAWGCDVAVLQASEMAFALYEAMGFRTVVAYAVFQEPSA